MVNKEHIIRVLKIYIEDSEKDIKRNKVLGFGHESWIIGFYEGRLHAFKSALRLVMKHG